MRKVFDYGGVANRWAYQSQQEARSRGNRMFFEGPVIYSYGYHFAIAKIYREQKVVLLTSRSSSRTTSKHVRFVYSAINNKLQDYKMFIVKEVDAYNHKKNLERYINIADDNITYAYNKAIRPKIIDYMLFSAKENINLYGQYIEAFNLKGKDIPEKKYNELLDWMAYVKEEVMPKLIVHRLSK